MIESVAVLLLLLMLCVVTLGFVLAARDRERAIAQRVDLIAAPARRPTGVARSAWVARIALGLRAFFAFHMRRSWGIATNPLHLLMVGVAAAAAVWLLCNTVLHVPLYVATMGTAAAFFVLPRILLIMEQRHRDAEFAEQLPDAIDMVVRIVRAGLPAGAAIRTVGEEAAKPLSNIFAQAADQADIGTPLDEALERTSETVGNADFRFFAVAVALQQATGGNLAETLETLGEIIRKRRAVRLKAGAATAEVRLSAIILGVIPFFVTGALLIVAPTYLDPLIADPRGNVILGAALLSLLLGGLTMRTMIRNSLST